MNFLIKKRLYNELSLLEVAITDSLYSLFFRC